MFAVLAGNAAGGAGACGTISDDTTGLAGTPCRACPDAVVPGWASGRACLFAYWGQVLAVAARGAGYIIGACVAAREAGSARFRAVFDVRPGSTLGACCPIGAACGTAFNIAVLADSACVALAFAGSRAGGNARCLVERQVLFVSAGRADTVGGTREAVL